MEWIRADLLRRGLLYPPLREEIVDHICDAVEAEMASGIPFMNAYEKVVASFGPKGLSELNHQTFSAIGKTAMLQNYFKLAVRNLRSRRLYTGINLVGLVLGLSSCLLILLYVQEELSYDAYHQKADRIFRLTSRIFSEGKDEHIAWGSSFLAPILEENYPEVEQVIRMRHNKGKITVKRRDQAVSPVLFSVDQVYYVADAAFFDVFTYPMLAGNPRTALAEPASIVLTESLARQYYGEDWFMGRGILGKTLDLNGVVYRITGVLKDVPAPSDLPFRALLSLDSQQHKALNWCITYVLFRSARAGEEFGPKLEEITRKVQPEFARNGASIKFYLENLREVHFGAPKLFDTPKTNKHYLYIFSVVAGFILLIGSINYVNLSIAQSAVRSVEVGIRKAVGAARVQLVLQFLGESVLLTLAAVVLALLCAQLLLPVYNQVTGKSLSLGAFFTWQMALVLMGMFMVVGIVAGSYPALYLASFEPVQVLKGKLQLGRSPGKSWLRQGLVVLQFTISVAMIAGTLVIYRQMRYMQEKHLGFEQEQVLLLDIPDDPLTAAKAPALREALLRQASLTHVALSGYNSLPGRDTDMDAFGLEKGGQMVSMPLSDISIDEHYLPLLKIPFAAGRNFKGPVEEDAPYEFVINEALVRKMGWGSAQAAIGKRVNIGQDDGEYDGEVVGVVKDFHFHSLHKPIEPILMMCDAAEYPEKLMIRLPADGLTNAIATVRQQWQSLIKDHPFAYAFLDASFDEQYRTEQRMVPVFTYFACLTILIACLGLFGLVSFATQQRTKEVGIRKVMGASPVSILYLLSREFVVLVLVAVLLASPIAWYGLNRWLSTFAYRTQVGIPVFVGTALLALLIAALTTGYHALRGAKTNPVKALRYE